VTQAILGGEVEVLTMDGMVTMKVPTGTQPDTLLLLRGKGVRSVNNYNQRGNQVVKLKVTIPTKLTPRQKELMEEFGGDGTAKSSTCDTHKAHNIISDAWSRLKDFLGSKDAAANKENSKASSNSSEKTTTDKASGTDSSSKSQEAKASK
jgi:DnaJ-class molecular chaperone